MKIGDKINFRTCKETTRHWQFSQKSRENGPYRKKKKKVSFLVICKRNIGSHLLMSDSRTFETFGPQATLCMVWYANTYCCSFSIINNISTYQSSTCYLNRGNAFCFNFFRLIYMFFRNFKTSVDSQISHLPHSKGGFLMVCPI